MMNTNVTCDFVVDGELQCSGTVCETFGSTIVECDDPALMHYWNADNLACYNLNLHNEMIQSIAAYCVAGIIALMVGSSICLLFIRIHRPLVGLEIPLLEGVTVE